MKHLREKDTRAETGARDKEGYCHEMRAEMPASLINLSTIEFYQVGPDLSAACVSEPPCVCLCKLGYCCLQVLARTRIQAARTLHLCSDKEALLIVDVFTCKSERR